LELIRNFPEIFPNFYLLLTPDLDRALLLELREFLPMATYRFRWLLGAADQATTGILDLFVEWVDQRKSILPVAPGPDLRHYYRTPAFQKDFIRFLRRHRAGKNPKVKALVDFYERLAAAIAPDEYRVARAVELRDTEGMSMSDLAIRKHRSRMVELAAELEVVIDAVKTCREYSPRRHKHFYVISQMETREHPGYEVSNCLATVLELCDGQRTVAQIMDCLTNEIRVTPDSARAQVYEALLEKARTEGLIAIYRTALIA
jgi:hypothetical protein